MVSSMQLKPKQPEKYNGNRDFQVIDNWITSVDSYFALTNAQPPQIYYYLNTILTGEAAVWYRFHFQSINPETITWENVKAMLKGYFVPPNHKRRLRDEWAYLRQTTTVSEYYARLTQLAMQLHEVDEERLVDKFVRGLKPKTRTEVELHDPQTLADASRIADRFDTIVYRKPIYLPSRSPPTPYNNDSYGEPMQLDTLRFSKESNLPDNIQIDALKLKPNFTKLKKLSEEERTHLRSIGACFKCRKTGHMARECADKNSTLPSGNSRRQ